VTHSIIGWIIIGILAGWLTGKVTRGKGFGLFANLFLGLIGAVIADGFFSTLGIAAYGFIGSLAAATVGAVLLVSVARLFAGGGEK
jgi:Predicted membrane protein